MDKVYADTVRLLLDVAPDAFANPHFAMKGGTAINLFVRDMPRLSVDIDVVYLPHDTPRQAALDAINAEIDAMAGRLEKRGLVTRRVPRPDIGETRLLVENDEAQVKVEINSVFRGSVLPAERHPLSPQTAEHFARDLSVPVLATAELYGSKQVAALDRQHPRDLFDVMLLLENEGLSADIVECCVVYLAGHNRPLHEVLFPRLIDNTFRGMTREPVPQETLEAARERLLTELPARLQDRHRQFLSSLARAEPDWSLLSCAHAAELPALRWKLQNLERFREKRRDEFDRQVRELEEHPRFRS